jgi:hypothetical protein
MNYNNFNLKEVLKRMLKYFIEGLVVSFAAFWIPKRKMDVEEILVIAITAATTFAVLDMWAPAVSTAARWGTGFGIGASLGINGAGPIFPAENFVGGAALPSTEELDSILPTEQSSELLSNDSQELNDDGEDDNILNQELQPTLSVGTERYRIPASFKRNLVPNFECSWEVDPKMVIDDGAGSKTPQGFIGKCQSKEGRDHAVNFFYKNSK